ncbi:glycine dehydrogenase (decarboxylating) alpha subunit [Dethiosulfatibacter aminovorans DSM 17477]|uniref:Probable glycine dehydrogenase (decarboxylating) subunit 1 n=1 Tax=Dethiosulfatibacter aminovorans DSM 17477 TaxID=1121476 RepID=A0A1M6ECQ1_9FIRM|nr:aminomethyl-transferring glycine dehydrogenase subunit GcvPA [Dethiosulfatibacter aminovorans]SHI83254.1 glycine dehydrogenase (decarboxylating) alpha subunit [Dethiosulfatibacter aminovorans DSM 17477]
MNKYIPLTREDRKVMLDRIGVESVDDLFGDIPEELQLKGRMNINDSMSEMEVRKIMRELSTRNKNLNDYVSFLGAGSYDHYIPSTVKHIYSRSEFYTSYTPYQPEISQGTLQYIFEYQSMMAELTGMDVINASMYDGATAAAEAAIMAVRIKKKNRIAVSATIHPETMRVLETYCHFREIELVKIPENKGRTCSDSLDCIDGDTSAVIVQNPNFYGIIEDVSEVEKRVHENKGLLIMSVDPISLGLLKTPGEWGADIVVGEGQSLGMTQSFGGPYLGFIGTTTKLMRKLPGRICGMTEDVDGKPGYVLTLQAREQHIRREKATSNICSNQSLCALMAVAYLSTMGKEGIKEVAEQSMTKAEYAKRKLLETGKFNKVYEGPFFKEFMLESKIEPEKLNDILFENGMIGPLNMSRLMDNHDNHVLFAVTEKRTKEEIDRLVEIIGEVE